jgi:MFS family permease
VAAGYLYDLFGRKKTIFIAFVALSVAIFCLPYLSKVWELAVCRSTLQTAIVMLHSNPLLIDYVKKEARGKATAFQGLGNGIGETIALTLFLAFQINLGAEMATSLVALVVLLMSAGVICMVREPKLKSR